MINRLFRIHNWMDKQTRKRAIEYKVIEVFSVVFLVATIIWFAL